MQNKPEYTRTLPHYHHVGATFFVTFRLYNSLPKSFLDELSAWYNQEKERIEQSLLSSERLKALALLQRDYFRRFDRALDPCLHGPTFLSQPAIASEVVRQLKRFDGQYYHLQGYTILPNHGHILLDFSAQADPAGQINRDTYKNLDYVMQRIKGASARAANLILKNTGTPFWQQEYHDRYIRDRRHLLAAVDYLKQNAVSARLCRHWQEHAFTWIHERFW
ncbi:MAG: hypothetical protein LCH81_02040 [Bacteroidetes bacterium]|nr:hypothetical protein [Bacteroidota bacterium]